MTLSTVSTGQAINANDLNQAVNVLQEPSGGTETGSYYLAGWAAGSNVLICQWIPLLSRNATPVSASVDTTIAAPTSIVSPSANNLYSSGFLIASASTGATTNGNCGGVWTVHF